MMMKSNIFKLNYESVSKLKIFLALKIDVLLSSLRNEAIIPVKEVLKPIFPHFKRRNIFQVNVKLKK